MTKLLRLLTLRGTAESFPFPVRVTLTSCPSPEEKKAGLDLSDHVKRRVSSDSVQLLKRERKYEENRSDHQAFEG